MEEGMKQIESKMNCPNRRTKKTWANPSRRMPSGRRSALKTSRTVLTLILPSTARNSIENWSSKSENFSLTLSIPCLTRTCFWGRMLLIIRRFLKRNRVSRKSIQDCRPTKRKTPKALRNCRKSHPFCSNSSTIKNHDNYYS